MAIVFGGKTLYSFVQSPTLPSIKVNFWISAKYILKSDKKSEAFSHVKRKMQFTAQEAQTVSAAPLCRCDVLEVSVTATVGKRGATGS